MSSHKEIQEVSMEALAGRSGSHFHPTDGNVYDAQYVQYIYDKAYARELDDTNTVVLKEIDLLDQPEYWGGYFDGEHYFINMGFRYEGKTLKA